MSYNNDEINKVVYKLINGEEIYFAYWDKNLWRSLHNYYEDVFDTLSSLGYTVEKTEFISDDDPDDKKLFVKITNLDKIVRINLGIDFYDNDDLSKLSKSSYAREYFKDLEDEE